MTEPGAPEPVPQPAPQCPWCGAAVTEGATHCPDCGAAVAQRESIGGLKIAGLTSVDPALEDFDKRPLHLRGPSPSQGVAPALIIGAAAGGPIGLVAIGGVAAVAAAELMGSKRDGSEATALENVGKPSEVLLQALERADAEVAEGAAGAGGDPATDAVTDPAAADTEPDHAAEDGGRSIWRDLPTAVDPEGTEGSV